MALGACARKDTGTTPNSAHLSISQLPASGELLNHMETRASFTRLPQRWTQMFWCSTTSVMWGSLPSSTRDWTYLVLHRPTPPPWPWMAFWASMTTTSLPFSTQEQAAVQPALPAPTTTTSVVTTCTASVSLY